MYPLGLDMLSDEFYIHLSALLVCVWRIHSHVKNANAPTISAKCIDTHHNAKCVDLANIFRINLPSRTNWVLLNYMELNANSEWMEHSISTYTFTKNESYILINHKRSREICGRSNHFKWTEFCGYHNSVVCNWTNFIRENVWTSHRIQCDALAQLQWEIKTLFVKIICIKINCSHNYTQLLHYTNSYCKPIFLLFRSKVDILRNCNDNDRPSVMMLLICDKT